MEPPLESRRVRPPNGSAAPSTADLLRELRDESSLLFKQEVALAKAELKESAMRAVRGSITAIVGLVVALMGIALMTTALSLGIAQLFVLGGFGPTLANFLGFLIGALLFVAIGAGVGYAGWKRLANIDFYPRKTINHLKEETQCIKDRI